MQQEHEREGEWQSQWKIVLAATAGCCAGVFHLAGIMTLTKPLGKAFGWSRGEVTSSLFVIAVVILFAAPLVGGLIDRFGPRRIALIGMPLYVVLISAVSLSGPQVWTWYVAWALAACAAAFVSPMLWTVGVAEHFTRNQGKAVGITMCGSGIATMLSLPFSYYIEQRFGWRAVFPALSITSFALAYPLIWLFFHDTAAAKIRMRTTHSARDIQPGLNFADAMKTSRFWRIALAMFLTGAAMNGLIVHLNPMLTDQGIPAADAAFLVALIGPCAIAGRIVTGFLFDYVFAPLVGAIEIALAIISCLLLSSHNIDYAILIPAIALLGLVASSEAQVGAYLLPRYFGYRSYGRIYGFAFGVMILGMGAGPAMGGMIFDVTGSYSAMILAVIALSAVSALLVGTLGRYPTYWQSREAEPLPS